ncbi:glycosyltransferase family 2 protein [Flavobacterium bomense]|uniref:Glycosyltransferase family 2 protein n=1 Tax=Flavobacterium bomense TaxID=2497483 RepID=A0A3S0PJX9_9FLAO|nr:glycosyltransferase family A protein [Flavobacterium bomense]RTZ06496.1 glycosyltransferase family 2 protein [Flavobacterium bomense]
MHSDTLVSIIIPCYNDAQYILQSVNSALNQTYPNKEVIVVDDGSNAETKAVLKKLAPKITKLITQENQGQSTARNVGIKEAKGEYILVLDSDDYFEPTFCEKAVAIFESRKEVKIISSFVNRVIDDKIAHVFKPYGGNIKPFLSNNQATGSCMILKSDFLNVNGYDEKMRKGFEDWEFYIRLLKDGGEAFVIQEPLFNYRLRNDSTTSKANKIKYDLLKYIYMKHQDLYKANYELFISHLLNRIEREETEKIKNTHRLEFKIGKTILKPFRWVKSVVK